jgi:predicted secreted protein
MRLAEILGALQYLRMLCGASKRQQVARPDGQR